MSSFDEYEKAKFKTKATFSERPVLPQEQCRPEMHTPPQPIKGYDMMDGDKDTQRTILWVILIALITYIIWFNHLRGPTLAPQITEGLSPKDASVDVIEHLEFKFDELKGWLVAQNSPKIIYKQSPPKVIYKNTETVKWKTRLKTRYIQAPPVVKYVQSADATAIEARRLELEHRRKTWEIFYSTPLDENEISRTHCFGDDCRTITKDSRGLKVRALQ